jgi:hypothetical protein
MSARPSSWQVTARLILRKDEDTDPGPDLLKISVASKFQKGNIFPDSAQTLERLPGLQNCKSLVTHTPLQFITESVVFNLVPYAYRSRLKAFLLIDICVNDLAAYYFSSSLFNNAHLSNYFDVRY